MFMNHGKPNEKVEISYNRFSVVNFCYCLSAIL